MIFLITGGSGSGKSAYAEKLALTLAGNQPLYYFATMQVFDEESRLRVIRHQTQRKGKGFLTRECPFGLLESACDITSHSTILMECMSNLLANIMFDKKNRTKSCEDIIIEQIQTISGLCQNLLLVTNEVFSDGNCYDNATEEYIQTLGSINCRLAALADEVYEVVYGLPVCLKEKKQ